MVRRLRLIGVKSKKIMVMNNVKYSIDSRAEAPFEISKGSGAVVVAGSIRSGEEEIVIDGFIESVDKKAVLVIAPRHLRRVGKIKKILSKRDVPYSLWSSVKQFGALPEGGAVIVDTIGDLSKIYLMGTVAIIGGGFVRSGGHNPMEAAVAGLPMIFGPNMFNFEDTADKFVREGGAFVAANADDIAVVLSKLLSDTDECVKLGRENALIIEKLCGSAETTAMIINEILLDVKT